MLKINSVSDAIKAQIHINRFLLNNGIRDLVGDYGEILIERSIGGRRENSTNKGFDIKHPKYGKIEVKTRKYELKADGKVRKENRAVGFKNKEGQFDWLAHIVLGADYQVVSACLAKYDEVWPEIQKTGDKVGFTASSSLPSSLNISSELRKAQKDL